MRRAHNRAVHNTRIVLHIFSIDPSLFAPVIFNSHLTWHESVCSPGLLLSLCVVTPEPEPRRELAPPPPAWYNTDRSSGGQGPARGQWCDGDGITRLNNVRIMGLKPRLSMGSVGSHNCQTTGISAFSNPRSLAGPRPPSRWHLGILLHDKIEIGVDTPSSWNATNASPWISN